MTQQGSLHDDLLAALIKRLAHLERRLVILETGESGAIGPAGADAPDEFILLTDTPADYTGQAGKLVRVNATPDGLEFADGSGLFVTLTGDQTVAGVKSFSADMFVADKVVHIGDTDTAFRFPANDTVAIETAGAERVRVDSAGNVGVGTASPAGRLHVVFANVGDAIVFQRNPSFVGAPATSFRLRTRHSAAITDNSGPTFSFQLEDSGGTVTEIADIGAARDGANNSGALIFLTRETGTQHERARITAAGNMGVGVSAPRGRLHVHDGTGGSLFWTATGIAGSAVTIIPDGTGDVVRKLIVQGVVRGSNGNTRAIAFSEGVSSSGGVLTPGGAALDLFDSATNVVKLRVNANGSVDVRRTAGTLTYDVALHLVWL